MMQMQLLISHCSFSLYIYLKFYHHATSHRRTQKLHLDTVLAAAVAKEAQERIDIHKLQQVRHTHVMYLN
jgi:hypothetical protein